MLVLKRFADKVNTSAWKITLNHFFSEIGGELILKSNFDTRKLPVYLPVFHKECLDTWSMLNQSLVLSYEDFVHQVIWNNKILLFKGSRFSKHICFLKELL